MTNFSLLRKIHPIGLKLGKHFRLKLKKNGDFFGIKSLFLYLSTKLITTKTVIGLLGIVAVLSWLPYLLRYDQQLHISFLDVGQGDAILIETPLNQQILIDGGPDGTIINHLSNFLPFYDRSLDMILLTHPHSDHLTGLIDVLRRYEVKLVALADIDYDSQVYKTFKKILEEAKINVLKVETGDSFDFGGGVVGEVWWPKLAKISECDANKSECANINDFSVVLKLDYQDFEVVLTGDAEAPIQGEILDLVVITEDIEVLKVPHQGAKDGLNKEFLKLIDPKLAVISVGERNRYGHPEQEVIDFIESLGAKVKRTDKDGSIEVISSGKTWQIL